MIIRKVDEDAGVHYQIHPAAMIFPEMAGDEWNNLVVDIRDNGQREPIIVHDGKVIDGRNRLRACRWLKIDPKVKQYHGREEDILPYVMSLNLHRRHLTESQRAMIGAKIATMKQGARTDLKQTGSPVLGRGEPRANLHEVSSAAAATMLNVSERSVKTAKQVQKKGEPEVLAAIESGAMTLNEASKIVQLRPELQVAAAAMPKAERRETLAGNTLDEMQVDRASSDKWGEERVGLELALENLCEVRGTPEQLISECPKFAAPGINKHFRQAFMKMQALNAVYQNWEFRNVNND